LPRYTIDTNVVINWLVSRSSPAEAFFAGLTQEDELISPFLLIPECTSVLREEVFARRLRHDEAQDHLQTLLNLPVTLFVSPRQFLRALDLAEQFQHQKAYDMQYVSVAELAEATLVTGDRGPLHAAREIGVPVLVIR
jgi:predicted nucleic acid-binding protein